MAVPGWPALAFCTASMARQRMVSIESVSMSAGMRLLGIAGAETVAPTPRFREPSGQQLADALLGAADDGALPAYDDRTLQQRGALHEQLDDRLALDVVGRVESELPEHGVLAHEVGDRTFEPVDDALEGRPVGPLLHVEHDVVGDAELVGDRERVLGRVAVRVVVDRHVGHAADASGRLVDTAA